MDLYVLKTEHFISSHFAEIQLGVTVLDIYVARQPILDTEQKVYAYELLYRSNEENTFSDIEGEQATSNVINSILQIGFEELSEGKPCFINFTEKLLELNIPDYLHPEMIVIEILETVNPTDQVIENCKRLKMQGFTIALDDFEMKSGNINFYKLLGLADIIKVDIRATPRDQQLKMMRLLKSYDLVFLAEKVETRAEYEQCLKDGYTYFQGYFFSKPVILSTSDVPIQKQNVFLIMHELSKQEPDFEYITTMIEADLSLSYKLLRLSNSSVIGPIYQIKSIKQAILFLGLKELKKWIYVLSYRETTNTSDPIGNEIIKLSFTRAKISELIALAIGKRNESSSYFLIGMLSLIDALLKKPLNQLLKSLPLEQDIRETLLGVNTPYSEIFELIIAVERADWNEIEYLCKKVGVGKQRLFQMYQDSMKWTNEIMKGSF
ncbi:EAL and HDOD domain-containing protein [Bacillus niameyensis]|uniref:EAL and HDOD domain-containing protein n=1 Tax=Bacillus niameyensis TaxID=1522308 RepID=UPI001E2B7843|nr:EAL domain-containing protein [Bacillus niameyensis]